MRSIGIVAFLSVTLFTACLGRVMAQDQASQAPESAAAAAQPSAQSPAQVDSPPAEYKLQTDDIIRIDVWGEPNLFVQQTTVDPNGYINMPQVGQIHTEGLTQQKLTDKIKEGLTRILNDPKVQVTILSYRRPRVYVLGQVNRPGLHEFKRNDRVMEAIAQAGSFTEMADLEGAKITHAGSEESIPLDLKKIFYEGDMSQNLLLQDSDTIYLPEDVTNKYYVLGEVLRPGMYRLKKGVTVMEAISTAAGPTERANLKSAYVIRGDLNNPQRIRVDINKIIKQADLTQNLELKPGDVVYIAETSKPDWSKIGSMLSVILNSSYLFRTLGL